MKTCSTRVLITGADGQLGQALCQHKMANEFDIIACSRTALNILDEKSIQQAIDQHRPDIIINTAAYTAVDKAEQDQEKATLLNATGPALLAVACQQNGISLMHISTDYVFDGQQNKPYQETDAPHPINMYGHTKLLGEELVRNICEQHIILRVSSVFSEHGHNFLKTILRLAKEKDTLRIVADQITCPTYAGHIADVIQQLVNHFEPGTYHYCDGPAVTWHQFASTIIEAAAEIETLMIKEVLPITTVDYPTPAKRPSYSVLDNHLIQQTFPVHQADWRVALPTILRYLKGSLS